MRETFALVRKTPGCLLLLFGNFAITFGSNLVLPYLAVYLTVEQGISPGPSAPRSPPSSGPSRA